MRGSVDTTFGNTYGTHDLDRSSKLDEESRSVHLLSPNGLVFRSYVTHGPI